MSWKRLHKQNVYKNEGTVGLFQNFTIYTRFDHDDLRKQVGRFISVPGLDCLEMRALECFKLVGGHGCC